MGYVKLSREQTVSFFDFAQVADRTNLEARQGLSYRTCLHLPVLNRGTSLLVVLSLLLLE